MNEIIVSSHIKKSQTKINKKFKIYLGNIIDFENYPLKIGPVEIEKFSDNELYDYCKFTGINAKIWSRRFVAAIPEVARRNLHIKHGFYSIYEFAAKVGGISNNTVNVVLWLNEVLKDRPILKSLIGEIGINKIRVVVRVVTKETESFWAQKVKDMSKPALEVLVREVKKQKEAEIVGQGLDNGIVQKCLIDVNNVGNNQIEQDNNSATWQKYPGINLTENEKGGLFAKEDLNAEPIFKKPERINFSVPIDLETEFQLRKYKLNLEKTKREPVDWNSTLKELVKKSVTYEFSKHDN